MVTGSPVRLTGTGGASGDGGEGVPPGGARRAFWAVLAAVLVTAAVMPPIAGRRLRDRLTVPTEVPATATRDARLLKGAG